MLTWCVFLPSTNSTYSFDFKKIIKLLLRQTNKIDSTYYLHFICAWMQMFHRKMISSRKNEPHKLGFLVFRYFSCAILFLEMGVPVPSSLISFEYITPPENSPYYKEQMQWFFHLSYRHLTSNQNSGFLFRAKNIYILITTMKPQRQRDGRKKFPPSYFLAWLGSPCHFHYLYPITSVDR